MKTLVALGDSWTHGSELEDRTQAWPYQLAPLIGCSNVVNLGKEASSIYHLPLQIADFEKMGIVEPVFVVGITDEARYMLWDTQANDWHKLTGVPELARKPELSRFLKEFSIVADTFAFREFYLGMVITWLQNYFVSNKHQYIMYKQFNNTETAFFDSMIDWTHIYRNGESIFSDLMPGLTVQDLSPRGEPYEFHSNVVGNPYFEGMIAHPNVQGHKHIARLLESFYKTCYS